MSIVLSWILIGISKLGYCKVWLIRYAVHLNIFFCLRYWQVQYNPFYYWGGLVFPVVVVVVVVVVFQVNEFDVLTFSQIYMSKAGCVSGSDRKELG